MTEKEFNEQLSNEFLVAAIAIMNKQKGSK